MPFALLVLSGGGNAAAWPARIGPLCAGNLVAALAARDVFVPGLTGPGTGYTAVYCIEIALLVAPVVVMVPLIDGKRSVSFAGS